jgi:predicted NBD/HSP70 family sugar kinase
MAIGEPHFVSLSLGTFRKATMQDGRRRNVQAALQCVYREGLTSRADISRLTGLTRATVSELIAELVQEDLVREVGPGSSSGGKRPTLLSLNRRARDIVAIDLSRQPFRGALVDLVGTINHRVTGRGHRLRGRRGLQEVFRLVGALVESSSSPVLGIGVGTPGIVDDGGAVAEAANLDWHGVPLQAELAARFGVPVVVANDAHVAGLAEFGSHPGPNLVVVKVGVGIGAGIIVNGRLFRGDRPAAGEIGHVRVVARGDRCTCGNVGCLETVASVPSIIRRAITASGVGETLGASLPWDAVALSDVLGERPVREAVSAAGQKLGAVLAHLVAVLDIHRIVVALELENAEDELLRAVRAEVKGRVLPSLASMVEFSSSPRGGDLVLAGAAALVLSEQLGVVWQ